MVKRPAAGAADFVEYAIEHNPALFVFVEPFIEKVPQEAAALGNAPAISEPDALQRIRVTRSMFEKADQVASPGQTASEDTRVTRTIDNVVDAAHFEASL